MEQDCLVNITEIFGTDMNQDLIIRLYQDAYNQIMIPYLIVKNGSPILDYKTTDGVEGKIRQRFAELLIEECLQITLDYKNDDHYNGWMDFRDEIRKHFGVE